MLSLNGEMAFKPSLEERGKWAKGTDCDVEAASVCGTHSGRCLAGASPEFLGGATGEGAGKLGPHSARA